jgi:hypothetical protein
MKLLITGQATGPTPRPQSTLVAIALSTAFKRIRGVSPRQYRDAA